MRLRLMLAAAVVASSIASITPSEAASPGWLTRCVYTHSAAADPIVFPGDTTSSHLHDFVANPSTDAHSSYASMIGSRTTCGTTADTAGYWIPALYRKGVKVNPFGSYNGRATRQNIYYRDNNLNAGTPITPFPADFRLIAGNGRAGSVAQNAKLGKEIYWGCSDNSGPSKATAPVDCATGIITLHVGFPNCWDGVQTHKNDSAHLVYPSRGVCPAAFPIALPRVIERFEYPVGPSSAGITLASGPTYTAHADFWNTWQQAGLAALVSRCLNSDTNCGTNPTP